jgi:hypothetical protein
MEANPTKPPIHGVMAEFHSPESVLAAARKAQTEGFTKMDAYTPFPVEGLSEAVGFPKTRMPWLIFFGGLAGAAGGYLLQFWTAAIAYPLNVGGRPYNSIPYFVPITFESMILLAALTATFGMIILNGLPQPYHPVFNVKRFQFASQDRFYLCIEAEDPKFDRAGTAQYLESLGAEAVVEVDH